MKVLITGTSQGIGLAVAEHFLKEGHAVVGIDRQPAGIHHERYCHYQCDVRDYEKLPDIQGVNILVNNAGTQNEEDIDINLKALIHITEKYGVQEEIRSVLNIGSAPIQGRSFRSIAQARAAYWHIPKMLPRVLRNMVLPATALTPAASLRP